MDKHCPEHSGHSNQLKNLEEGHKEVTIIANAAHRRIDGMKNWVIAGMTSLMIQMLLGTAALIMYWLKTKTGG